MNKRLKEWNVTNNYMKHLKNNEGMSLISVIILIIVIVLIITICVLAGNQIRKNQQIKAEDLSENETTINNSNAESAINNVSEKQKKKEEQFKQAFQEAYQAYQELFASEENDENYSFIVENNQIKISNDTENMVLNYDLTDKPTFTGVADIKQGMSYKEFEQQTSGGRELAMIVAYGAIAKMQGVEFKDSMMYSSLCIGLGLIPSNTTKNVFDDLNMYLAEGVTLEKDPNDTDIYASEFGDHVMECVNDWYSEKQTFNDKEDGINSMEITREQKDVTDTSCKIVTTLTIDTSADFSALKGYADSLSSETLED